MVAELVLETTNEGIWLINAQARTTFVNRHTAELLGYSEDEMLGRHIFDFMDEEGRPQARENLLRRQRGIEERQEVKLLRKDGSYIWVIGSANPVYDRYGRYAGSLAVLGDLTPQKETERRLQAEVEELKRQGSPIRRRHSPRHAVVASADRSEPAWLVHQAIRSTVAIAVCGTFLGTVALATTGFVFVELFGRKRETPETPEY